MSNFRLPWLGGYPLPWTGGTYLGVPLPLLIWLGEGYLPWTGGTYLEVRLSDYPDLARDGGRTYLGVSTLEYPPPRPDLDWGGGTYLGWWGRGTYLRVPLLHHLDLAEGTYLGPAGTYHGVPPPPHPDLARGRLTTLDEGEGYLPWGTPPHILTWLGDGYLPWTGEVYLPWMGEGEVTYLWIPPSWPGCWEGYDLAGGGTYLGWKEGYLSWSTPSPPGVNRQTPVKTVPSRRTTYSGGNNV